MVDVNTLVGNIGYIAAASSALLVLTTGGIALYTKKVQESLNNMYELEKYREKQKHVARSGTPMSGMGGMMPMQQAIQEPFVDPRKDKAIMELREIKKKEREIERRKKELENQLGAV